MGQNLPNSRSQTVGKKKQTGQSTKFVQDNRVTPAPKKSVLSSLWRQPLLYNFVIPNAAVSYLLYLLNETENLSLNNIFSSGNYTMNKIRDKQKDLHFFPLFLMLFSILRKPEIMPAVF